MKKSAIIGALFGAIVVPLSTLGLAVVAVEFFIRPLILIPRAFVNAVIDTSTQSGGLTIGLLILASAAFYALFGMLFGWIMRRWGSGPAWMLLVLYVVMMLFVGNPGLLAVGA